MSGKVTIITGATSGIGEAAAYQFAARGDRVVLAGRRTEQGEAVLEKIKADGGEGVFVTADMASNDDIKAMVDAAMSTYGRLDYAFNNAGMGGAHEQLHEYTDANWEAVMAVNLTGLYRCMKYEIAAMLATSAKEEGGAAIANTTSSLAHRASELSGTAYTASKHGATGLTRQAAISYVRENIRINAVAPGATRTELLAPLIAQGPEVVAQINEINPIGRMMEPEEVAAAAVFLCSPAASGITGHSLPVEGGQLAKL